MVIYRRALKTCLEFQNVIFLVQMSSFLSEAILTWTTYADMLKNWICPQLKYIFQQDSALCLFASFIPAAANETLHEYWVARGRPFHRWLLYVTQATNHKSHNSHFKVSKMMCEDKSYADLPTSMVKSVPNIISLTILKTLCTPHITRMFKIICKVFITI
jgi:hypothetical protein